MKIGLTGDIGCICGPVVQCHLLTMPPAAIVWDVSVVSVDHLLLQPCSNKVKFIQICKFARNDT